VKLKLRPVGTSTGIIVPKEMLARLGVKKGDALFAVETPDGYLLTPYDPQVEKQLKLGREFIAKYRDTFRALANPEARSRTE
jgi:putative addiction module antidote